MVRGDAAGREDRRAVGELGFVVGGRGLVEDPRARGKSAPCQVGDSEPWRAFGNCMDRW